MSKTPAIPGTGNYRALIRNLRKQSEAAEFVLHVNQLGELVFVYADELADLLNLGDAVVARASHVEPHSSEKHPNCWSVDLTPVGGPFLWPFKLRGDALAAEREWLEAHLV